MADDLLAILVNSAEDEARDLRFRVRCCGVDCWRLLDLGLKIKRKRKGGEKRRVEGMKYFYGCQKLLRR